MADYEKLIEKIARAIYRNNHDHFWDHPVAWEDTKACFLSDARVALDAIAWSDYVVVPRESYPTEALEQEADILARGLLAAYYQRMTTEDADAHKEALAIAKRRIGEE